MRLVSFVIALALLGCSNTTTSGDDRGPAELPEQAMLRPAPAEGAPEGEAPRYELPVWQREDVQPKSERFGQTHGLETYRGKTLVVALLEGNCPFCRSNSQVAQQLQDELAAEGLDVQVVILGDTAASEFASRVSLPIFRDADGQAWEAMRAGATKHDTFVFGPDGLRAHFLKGTYEGDPKNWRSEIGAAVRKLAKPRA